MLQITGFSGHFLSADSKRHPLHPTQEILDFQSSCWDKQFGSASAPKQC